MRSKRPTRTKLAALLVYKLSRVLKEAALIVSSASRSSIRTIRLPFSEYRDLNLWMSLLKRYFSCWKIGLAGVMEVRGMRIGLMILITRCVVYDFVCVTGI